MNTSKSDYAEWCKPRPLEVNCDPGRITFELLPDFHEIETVELLAKDLRTLYRDHVLVARRMYYNFYFSYGRSWQPKRIFEIGVRFGYSAYAMCAGAVGAVEEFVGVDIEAEAHSNAIAHMLLHERVPSVNATMIKLDTQVNPLPHDIGKFDLIHVDGNHLAECCENDIELALTVANPGAYIVCDDIATGFTRRGFNTACETHDLDHIVLDTLTGHGIIRTKGGGS